MRSIWLALVLCMLAVPAHADGWVNPYSGTVWNNPMSNLADTMIRGKMNEMMWQRWYGKGGSAGSGGQAQAAAPANESHEPYSKTDFSPGKQRLVVDTIIASLTQTAEQRSGLSQGVAAVFTAYEQEQKVRKNNVAYALAFMVGASMEVQTGQQLGDDQALLLAQALNDVLARNPQFTKLGAGDRQKLYETFVTMGGLVLLFREVGKQDPASANAAKALAKQCLALVGANS
jgi:hypothetical protein